MSSSLFLVNSIATPSYSGGGKYTLTLHNQYNPKTENLIQPHRSTQVNSVNMVNTDRH